VTWTSYHLAILYTLPMGVMYILTPGVFLMGHAAGMEAEQFEHLQSTVFILLRFVAFYVLFDTTAVIFVSAIKGAGDTRFVLITTAWTSPLPLVLGTMGVHWFGWGLLWCWTAITGWICLVGLIYLLRFLGGRWKTMRVIESVAASEPAENEPVISSTVV